MPKVSGRMTSCPAPTTSAFRDGEKKAAERDHGELIERAGGVRYGGKCAAEYLRSSSFWSPAFGLFLQSSVRPASGNGAQVNEMGGGGIGRGFIMNESRGLNLGIKSCGWSDEKRHRA